MRYNPPTSQTKSPNTNNKLFPTILRALSIGIIIGNVLFIFSYMMDLPLIFHFSLSDEINVSPQTLVIVENPAHSVPNLNTPSSRSLAGASSITLQNRFLRRPPAKNCSLPPGFPGSPPGWKRLIRICGNLDRFHIDCAEDKACIDCIPPWGGQDWIIEWTNTFTKREYDTRPRRRNELQG
eukprot:314988_1